jgi:hypothetical protein
LARDDPGNRRASVGKFPLREQTGELRSFPLHANEGGVEMDAQHEVGRLAAALSSVVEIAERFRFSLSGIELAQVMAAQEVLANHPFGEENE